jgi:hypothetical protein
MNGSFTAAPNGAPPTGSRRTTFLFFYSRMP